MYFKDKPISARSLFFCGPARPSTKWAAFLLLAASWILVRKYNPSFPEHLTDKVATTFAPESRRVFFKKTSRAGLHVDKTVADACVLTTVDAYTPSVWEADWRQAAGRLGTPDNTVCAAMQQPVNAVKSAAWIAHLASCRMAGNEGGAVLPNDGSKDCMAQADPSIFSRFRKSCVTAEGRRVEWTEPIEPLVGHMRHPYANPQCLPQGVVGVGIEDRAYLMPLTDKRTVAHVYTGRKYLIDAGTSMYGTGLAWLVGAYERAGITFDEFFAWEASPVNATAYWAGVPRDVAGKLHFINVPIQAEAGAPMNPLTWIRDMFKPGDFIVFKLDIDNDAVESALIAQIAASQDLAGMIAEMYYEKHYREPAMEGYLGFNEQAAPYAEAVAMLGEFKGPRAAHTLLAVRELQMRLQ